MEVDIEPAEDSQSNMVAWSDVFTDRGGVQPWMLMIS